MFTVLVFVKDKLVFRIADFNEIVIYFYITYGSIGCITACIEIYKRLVFEGNHLFSVIFQRFRLIYLERCGECTDCAELVGVVHADIETCKTTE